MASLAAAAAVTTANLLSHRHHQPKNPFIFCKPLHLRRGSMASLPGLPLSSPLRCFSGGGGEPEHRDRLPISRPAEIPWSRDLANTVHLIGIVGAPVQIKHLSNGKIFAWSRLAIWKSASATDATWIGLSFWNELAETAFHYVVKGQQVYVCGRLVSDVVDVPDKKQVFYKIVVQQLNFIDKGVQPVSLYNSDPKPTSTWSKLENSGGNQDHSIEELWQAFFANPLEWWDNRGTKTNPNYPDFKHKDTKEALWVDGKSNPPWVRSQLAILDSKMGPMHANQTGSRVSMMYADDITNF